MGAWHQSPGSAAQTNAICPIPGFAQRDTSGNYYFAGSFDGTQNFGGITLVGGWTNCRAPLTPGYLTCFLAKYASNGDLQWVKSFGDAAGNAVSDLPLIQTAPATWAVTVFQTGTTG